MSIVMIVCAEHECACVRARASCDGVPLSGNVRTFKIGTHSGGKKAGSHGHLKVAWVARHDVHALSAPLLL